ncbi:hypothetical protein ACYOEI_05430 [Singulisphaera rosea]
MKAESIALFQELLDHHRLVCARDDGTSPPRSQCIIAYLELCTRARVPHLARYPGKFLQEIAEYCATNGWPPINSLAINAEEGHPGSHYDLAPGCNLLTWPDEVDACIRFRGYLERMPGLLPA